MAIQVGRNAGVTGLIDIQGAPKFTARVYRFSETIQAPLRPRVQPGVAAPAFRADPDSMQLLVSGTARADGFPTPASLRGVSGTITLQFNTGLTQSVPVVVQSAQVSYDEASQDAWSVVLTCAATGPVTWAGWPGTQHVPSAPAYSELEVVGRSKSLDPNELVESSVKIIDVDGLDAADATEVSKLVTLFAEEPPVPFHKLRAASLLRDGAFGATISLTFGLTDTKEDVERAQTQTTLDGDRIASAATVALVNAIPTPPVDQPFVERTVRTVELNDGSTLKIADYGLSTPKDDLQNPGRVIVTDPSDLATSGTHTDVYLTSGAAPSYSAPAGLQITGYSTETINRQVTKKVYQVGKTTEAQKVEYGASETFTDPSNLESWANVGTIDFEPSPPGLLVERGTSLKQLTPDHALYTLRSGLRTTEQDITFPGTWANVDPLGIEGDGQQVLIYATGGGVPGATVPSGLQNVGSRVQDENVLRKRVTYRFDVLNSEQKLEYPRTRAVTDPWLIDSAETRADVFTNGAPPNDPVISGLLKIDHHDIPVTPTKTLRVWEYGRNDSKTKIERGGSVETVDPLDIGSRMVAARLNAPLGPAVGWVERETSTRDLDADNTVYTTEYGLRNSEQDITMPGTWVDTDPLGVDTKGLQTAIYPTADPPPAATVPSGTQTVGSHVEEINQLKKKVVYRFDVLDSHQRLEYPRTRALVDPWDLDSERTAADVYTGSPPSDPVFAGLRKVGHADIPVTPTQTMRTWEYGKNSSKDRLLLSAQSEIDDPEGIASSIVAASLDVPPVLQGWVQRETRIKQPNPDHFLYVTEGGLRSTRDDLEMPRTFHELDPSGLGGAGTRLIVHTGAAPADPTPPHPSLKLRGRRYQEHDRTNKLFSVEWGVRTPEEDVTLPGTVAQASSDGSSANRATTIEAVSPADAPAAIAAARYATLRTDPTLAEIEVQKLTDSRARITVASAVEDKVVEQSLFSRTEWANSLGSVWMSRKVRVATSLWRVMVTPLQMPRTRGYVTLRRRIVTADVPSILRNNLIGKANAGTFLGWNLWRLRYAGPQVRALWSMEGTARTVVIDYRFEFDSWTHVDDSQVIVNDWLYLTSDPGSVPRFVNPSVFGWTISGPPTDNFDVFLT